MRSSRSSSETLADRAYRQIRDAILEGRYTAGAPLSSRALARELGMSFLPVLTALGRLQAVGLVESQPRVGTRLVVPTRDDVIGIYTLREALEVQAARLCAERATAAERRELWALAQTVDRTYSRLTGPASQPEVRRRANRIHASFHHRIAECARCPRLLDALNRSQVLVLKLLLDHTRPVRITVTRLHARLTKGLLSGDPDAAERAMRRHIQIALKDQLLLFDTPEEGQLPRPRTRAWRPAQSRPTE